MHMGHEFRVALGLMVLSTLFGCGSKAGTTEAKAADVPKQQTEESEESPFEQDAMEAVAQVVALWVSGATGDTEEPTGWRRHAASDTCSPTGSAHWVLQGEKTYGPDDESVTLFNEELATLMTLYTYPARGDIDAEFESVKRDIAGTCTEGPMMSTTLGETRYAACVQRLEDGLLLLEQAHLTQNDRWLNKVRITFPAAAAVKVHGSVVAFAGKSFKACPKAL